MIRHLNPMTFQDYGTILPERPESSQPEGKGEQIRRLALAQGALPVYRATSNTWLCGSSSMTVLAVRREGEEFHHFYLDKPVSVRPGVVFCLVPLAGESAIRLACDSLPAEVEQISWNESLQVSRRIRVESLYTFFYQEKEQGFLFPGEAHPMAELTYVDQGALHSVADGQDLLLEQGDVTIYAPDQWHMQYADVGVAPRFVTISFEVSGDLERLKNRKFRVPQQAVTLLQQMLREQEAPDDWSGDLIIAQLSQLLAILLRQMDAPQPKLKPSNAVHSENEIIRCAQQFISEHIREKLSVPIVAKQVEVSPSYLTALFHKNLQITPGEYIRRIKLQESKQMIRENSMNFTEIAAALQYSTVHHFSRQFKEKFGLTPTEYARSVR